MDELPDINREGLHNTFSPSENDTLVKSKQEFSDHLNQIIDDIKDKFSNIASKTFQSLTKSFRDDMLAKAGLLLELASKPVNSIYIKKFIEQIMTSIDTLDRLIFLARYFNAENDEAYLKTLIPRETRLVNIIYNFNVYMFWWIKTLIENIQLDPKDLLAMFVDSQQKGVHAVSTNLFTTKLPKNPPDNIDGLVSMIITDNYYLDMTYERIKEDLDIFTRVKIPYKVETMMNTFNMSSGSSSPALLRLGENFIKENPVIKELQKELKTLEKISDDREILEYLYSSKKRLDGLVKEASKYENEIQTAARKYISQSFARHEESNIDEDIVPLEEIDKVIKQELQNLCNMESETLQEFIGKWEDEAKTEILRLLGRQKDMLKDHLSQYMEERLVTFYQGKDFASSNLAKHIQDFCITASKEYKKVFSSMINQEFEVCPVYYCYVAENQCDFYLIEYNADSTVLRVYLTAGPMMSTLYKHLSKLDMQKIGKKNVLVTLLNYYDIDVNLEFRQVFLNSQSLLIENSKQAKVSQGLKDLIYITIFLLYNTPASKSSSEIHLTSKDFASFFNYAADYHIISESLSKSKENIEQINQNNMNPSISPGLNTITNTETSPGISPTLSPTLRNPETFDFRIPFINLKQPKNIFLIQLRGNVLRENSVLVKQHIAYQYSEMLKYKLLSDEDLIGGDIFSNEVVKYLKKNEKKPNFNFDGIHYLLSYLNFQRRSEGAIKIISKRQSHKIFELYRTGEQGQIILEGLDDYSKFARIYFLFSFSKEQFPVLAICINRKTNFVTIYRHNKKNVEDNDTLHDFALFLGRILDLESTSLELNQVKCQINDETLLKYLKTCYFPFTCLFNIDIPSNAQPIMMDVSLGLEDLINAFKEFISINITENSLETFNVSNIVFDDKANNAFRVINLGTAFKYSRLKDTIKALASKMYQDQVKKTLISFNFLGAAGYKTYYISFCELIEKTPTEIQSPGMSARLPVSCYGIDIFSLDYNLELDDQEILLTIAHVCQTSQTPQLMLTGAYKVKAQYNILFHNQVGLTLNTLRYLVEIENVPLENAFRRISRSIVSHYEAIEEILCQTISSSQVSKDFAKQRALSVPQNSQVFNFNQGNVVDFQEKAGFMKGLGLEKITQFDSLFEDLKEEIELRKEWEGQSLTSLQINKGRHFTEEKNIQPFLHSLNLEDHSLAYSFIVDEHVFKKLLSNEGNILKNVSTFLIEEVIASKIKYEESLEFKYAETQLFFLVPYSLFKTNNILFIRYNVERAESTFCYLSKTHSQKSTPLQSDLKETQNKAEEVEGEEEKGNLSSNRSQENHEKPGFLKRMETTQSRDFEESSRSLTSFQTENEIENENIIPKEFRDLMENFSLHVTRNQKSKQRPTVKSLEIYFGDELLQVLKPQYGLIIKLLMYYFSHQGSYLKKNKLEIKASTFNSFLCDYANKLWASLIEKSKIKDNYKQLCNMFLDKSCPLGKRPVLIAFLNGEATINQLPVIETCLQSFKQDFYRIQEIEHAFFCFSMNVRQSSKNFIIYLSGQNKKQTTVKIITNEMAVEDQILIKMVQNYCLEDPQTGGDDPLINHIQVYALNIPNVLFMTCLEVSTILLANAVCNDFEDLIKYCAQLTFSPVYYLEEMKEFEAKCEKLGVF